MAYYDCSSRMPSQRAKKLHAAFLRTVHKIPSGTLPLMLALVYPWSTDAFQVLNPLADIKKLP